jgi:hypothetical protein
MHTIQIPEANITRYIPSELAECTRQEYLDMCDLLFRWIITDITYEELRVHAVYKLMNMKPKNEFLLREQEDNKFGNIHLLSELIDDFFEINQENQKTIKQNYIHNPIPFFRPRLKTYYGPTDQFANIKFGEYCDALRLFHQFNATGDVQLLFEIAAILYRPKKAFHFFKKRQNNYDGDVRIKYNAATVEERAKAFRYMPMGFIYGFYLFFASFQKTISTAEIDWAGKKIDLSILFQSDRSDDDVDVGHDDIGMDAIMFSMAESGVFGTQTELQNTSVMMVLIRMYDVRLKDLKIKKQQEDAERSQT